MVTLNYLFIALIFEAIFLLTIATIYFFTRLRRSRKALLDLTQQTKVPDPQFESAINNKRLIINMLMEKLDCFDESNTNLESFREKFLELKQDYLDLRNDTLRSDISTEPTQADSEHENQFESKLDTLEQELNQLINNATTIVGEINRDKICG